MCIHCSVGQDEGECQCAEIAKLRAKTYELRERNRRLAKRIKKATAEGERLRAEVERHRMTGEEREAVDVGIQACEDITYGGVFDQPAADTMRRYIDRTKDVK